MGLPVCSCLLAIALPLIVFGFRYAWPPHQIMAWVGLERYGYLEEAQRLAYRFLYMMTVAFVDFNGVVPEKVCARVSKFKPALIALFSLML